uniref:Shugoshin C-terminal domain-containing protein n=1 Tax=Leptobrachium leishanense TaxID=445787 RepID=A0A8C5PSB7_9ANUR
MDNQSGSSNPSLQSLKDRMREKINASLKATRLNTSLAAKIKSKALNNSSILKISLKHNNKALACALTVEKEKSRRLENDKMFLQKEVEVLLFQNALLRQNLSIVHKIFKDIDIFMSINLPTGIEISSNMESLDIDSKEQGSERLSQQSRSSYVADQVTLVPGVPLRVPCSAVGEQRNEKSRQLGETSAIGSTVHQPLNSALTREKSNRLDTLHTSSNSPRESFTLQNEKLSDEASPRIAKRSNENLDSLDKNLSELFGFVTRRKKTSRSTSRSSSQTSKSRTTGEGRESNCSSPSEQVVACTISTDRSFLQDPDDMWAICTKNPEVNSFEGKKQPPDPCLRLSSMAKDCDKSQGTDRIDKQPGCAMFPTVSTSCGLATDKSQAENGSITQERTVYEADMEMTTTNSASIVAVSSKNKNPTGKTKSGIPVKHNGTTLRKVKKSVRGKTKAKENPNDLFVDYEANVLSNSTPKTELEDEFLVHPFCDPKSSKVKGDMIPESGSEVDSMAQPYVMTYSIKQEPFNVPVSKGIVDNDTKDVDVPAVTVLTVPVLTPSYEQLIVPSEKNELPHKTEKTQFKGVRHKLSATPPKSRLDGIDVPVDDYRHSKSLKSKTSKRKTNQKESKKCLEDHMFSRQAEGISDILAPLGSRPDPLRRETYIVNPTQTPVSPDIQSISRGNDFICRRETYVIKEPVPWAFNNHSTPEMVTDKEQTGTSTPPGNSLALHLPEMLHDNKSIKEEMEIPRTFKESTSNGCDLEKTIICPRQNDIYDGFNSTFNLSDSGTVILPDATTNEVTFAREPINKPKKWKPFAVDYLTKEQDSFVLDMDCRSWFQEQIHLPSFVRVSSVTNRESASLFITDKSNNTPLVELPGIDEFCHQTSSSAVCETNCSRAQISEKGDLPCEDLRQSLGSQGTASNPFKDLTNTTLSIKQSSKSCSEEEDVSQGHRTRRRNPVSYKEPGLRSKLRR